MARAGRYAHYVWVDTTVSVRRVSSFAATHPPHGFRRLGPAGAARVLDDPASLVSSSSFRSWSPHGDRLRRGRSSATRRSRSARSRPVDSRGIGNKVWVRLWVTGGVAGAARSSASPSADAATNSGSTAPPPSRGPTPAGSSPIRAPELAATFWSTSATPGTCRPSLPAWLCPTTWSPEATRSRGASPPWERRRQRRHRWDASGSASESRRVPGWSRWRSGRGRPRTAFSVRQVPVQIEGYNEGSERGCLSTSHVF